MRVMEPVNKREHVDEIFSAKFKIRQYAALWLKAIHEGNTEEAKRIRRESNELKRHINKKYSVIID